MDYIKLNRKLVDWEWYGNINVSNLLIYLLLLSCDSDYVLSISKSKLSELTGFKEKELFKSLMILNREGIIDAYYKNPEKKRSSKMIIVIHESDLYAGGNNHLHLNRESWIDFQEFCGRNYPEYNRFRNRVLQRDKYKCRMCGSTEKLEVHHIKSYSKYPKLRTVISNGITLCYNCHKEVHKSER